jgi:hypothetical protein
VADRGDVNPGAARDRPAPGPHLQVHLKSSQTYGYDDEAMSELQGYLQPEDYEALFETVTTIK